MAPLKEQQTDGQLLASISRAVVRIVHEYTGRGPTKARTSIRDDVVIVMLEETLLKAEHTLIRDGKPELVVEMRRTFQQTMRDERSATIAMLTEREVVGRRPGAAARPQYRVISAARSL
ncbi:MAG: Na-translocating system protein MpsC family protein [Actinomycetota bacterium]